MNHTLHYVFDPLCGWCYGAGAAVSALAAAGTLELRLLPSGMFSGDGARPMDDEFAAFAWSNDQRIERLTGQRFSQRYRTDVLGDRRQMFDSGPATVALTAVSLASPGREADALHAIQQARYVEGRDVTRLDTLAEILRSIGLAAEADRLLQPDDALLGANRRRTAKAQSLMDETGARGVPTFVLERQGRRQLVPAQAVYADPHAFLAQFARA